MTEKPEYEFLIAFAKILKKYSPDLSKALAEQLSSPELIKELVSLLTLTNEIPVSSLNQEIQSIAHNLIHEKNHSFLDKKTTVLSKNSNQSVKDSSRSHDSYPSFLKDLRKTESVKAELLIQFYRGLQDQSLLPKLQDIRNFASDMGLPPIKATSRVKAITPITKSLLSLNIEDLKKKLNEIMPVKYQDDRSLEAWANIILHKDIQVKSRDLF